jgi:hypothetical protein
MTAATLPAICRHVRQWIDNYRSDLYIAVALDKFIEMINGYLDTIGEGGKVTKEDVKTCVKYDDTVKIVEVRGGGVLLLWSGWRLHDLIDRAVELAAEEGEAAVSIP